MRKRRVRLAALAVVAAASLSACSTAATSQSSNSDTGTLSAAAKAGLAAAQSELATFENSPAKILQSVPLPEAPPRGMTAVYLVANNPAAQLEFIGAREATAAVGWNLFTEDYAPATPNSLNTALTDALTHHPAVVILSGSSPSEFSPSIVTTYAKAGVPIIFTAVGTLPSSPWLLGPVDGPPAFVTGATAMAAWLTVASKGHGAALLESVPGFPILVNYHNAFLAAAQRFCPDCTLKTVSITQSELASGTLVSAVTAELKANPQLKYVFFDDSDFAPGINSALAAAGLSYVKVGGQTMDPQAAAALRANTQSAWTTRSGPYTGLSALDLAFRWVEHAPLTANDLGGPTQLMTPQNIGSTVNWLEPSDELQQFETIWKVPVTGPNG